MIDLQQGDCLELMKNIPDKSVDMILCDLPYGATCNDWDKEIDLNKLFSEYERIVKCGGVVALFSQPPFNADLIQANRKHFRYEWIWEKDNSTGFLNVKKMPLKSHENILIFYDKLPTYNPQFTDGKPYCRNGRCASTNYGKYVEVVTNNLTGKRYPKDIIKFNVPKNLFGKKTDKLHPTQKPVDLLEYLIKTYTNEGETVLDNCMGSGSTGVACVNTSRNFIGIELDEHYFQVAKDRIANAQNQINKDLNECLKGDS